MNQDKDSPVNKPDAQPIDARTHSEAPKLRSPFLGDVTAGASSNAQSATTDENRKCPACGNIIVAESNGSLKRGCGWRPAAKLATFAKIVAVLATVGLIAAACWFTTHFYDICPDNKAADTFMKEADDFAAQHNFDDAERAYRTATNVSPRRVDFLARSSQRKTG